MKTYPTGILPGVMSIFCSSIVSGAVAYALDIIPMTSGIVTPLFITAFGTTLLSGIALHILYIRPIHRLWTMVETGAVTQDDIPLPPPLRRIAQALAALHALQELNEAKYAASLAAVAGEYPFVLLDTDATVTRLDSRVPTLLGFGDASDQFVCGPATALLSPLGEAAISLPGQCLRDKRPLSAEASVVHQGKPPRLIHITCLPLQSETGSLLGVCLRLEDQTEQREQEREIVAKNVRSASIADESLSAAHVLNSASEDLAERIQTANEGASQQQFRTTETATAMEQMNATVSEVARSASEAAKLAADTRQHSSHGAERMHVLETDVDAVGKVISTLGERVSELGTRAVDIGQVMNVINDIADQTNLLALNAAIEAARAGDAGRGFAVVADEVRKLAEKTMHATSEVGSVIHSIQDSSSAAVDEMQSVLKAVQEVTDSAKASGVALTEIVSLADQTSLQVQSIATAAEEQAATSEQINRAVEEITRIAAETMQTMNLAATDVFSLAGRASDLQRSVSRLHHSDEEAPHDASGRALPCWEHKRCGREKGGTKEAEMGICPAWPDHGFSCASVTGTFCGGKVQESFAKKIASCAKCDFFKSPHYDRASVHGAFEASTGEIMPRPISSRTTGQGRTQKRASV